MAADSGVSRYFINEVDEIRNVENPKEYFKYFITRTERTNNMHREGMHGMINDRHAVSSVTN
jgi:hypothetical protein